MRLFALTFPRLLLPLLIFSLTPGCGGAEAEGSSSLGSLNASGPDTERIGTVFTPIDVAVIVRSGEVEQKWDLKEGSVRLFRGEDGEVLGMRLMVWVEVDTIASYVLDREVEPSSCDGVQLPQFPDRTVTFDDLTVPAAPQESYAWNIASAPIVLTGALSTVAQVSVVPPR